MLRSIILSFIIVDQRQMSLSLETVQLILISHDEIALINS